MYTAGYRIICEYRRGKLILFRNNIQKLWEIKLYRFVWLDFMRWILALMVASMHLQGYGAPHKAYLAVDFFFILSGFVLTGSKYRSTEKPGFVGKFVTDRIARLYPLHFTTLLLLVFINLLFWTTTNGQFLENGWSYKDGRIYTFILNILLLQNIGLTQHTSWNAPSWSISVEFATNLCLCYYLTLKNKYNISNTFLYFVSILSYLILFNQYHTLGVFSETTNYINSGILRGIGGISLGILAWYIFEAINKKIKKLPLIWPIIFISMFLYIINFGDPIENVDFAAIPIMFSCVILLATAESCRPASNNIFTRAAVTLGSSSYAIYLIHWPIITFVRYQLVYAWGIKINLMSPLTMLIILSFVCIVSIAVYYFFELPMQKRIKTCSASWLSQ